jgi:preprotein translocase subunit SecA
LARRDLPDKIYQTETGKFKAVIEEIKERNKKGQPVLVGTVSIEKNELLGAFLKKEGIPHQILNAKNHEREAQIIAEAGRKGAVTVATNMAGRGVDIILGGRVDSLSKEEWQKEHDEVVESGGLHIIGTERHEARRIDNQLRGRAGRQGDPGSSVFMVSLEDDLMRVFGSDKIKRMMEVFNLPEDQPIENRMISKALEAAQAKIEGYNFDIRKHVLEYDDVMNKQRETIYRKRKEVLESDNAARPALQNKTDLINEESSDEDVPFAVEETSQNGSLPQLHDQIVEMTASEIKKFVNFHALEDYSDNWNYEEIGEIANSMFGLQSEERNKIRDFKDKEEMIEYLRGLAEKRYAEKEAKFGEVAMRVVEKAVMLQAIDMLWMDHLDNMDHLRDSVRLRAYGQRDPLVEYKNEGHHLFQELLANIQTQVVNMIFKVEITQQAAEARMQAAPVPQKIFTNKEESIAGGSPKSDNGVGRNDPCPCGSGKKYKKCCGK